MSARTIAGPAGSLRVDEGGRGSAAVLFVHSLAGTSGHWADALQRSRRHRRAVAFDLRGHGWSAHPQAEEALAIEALAGDVASVADACGLERFALVGHSLGGGVALAYAGLHPERVDRLLLLDPIGDGTRIPAAEVQPFLERLDSDQYTGTIESYWETIAGPDPVVRERLLRDLRATPRATIVGGFRAATRFDPAPAFARYRGPTLAVVTPANDAPFSLHHVGNLPYRVIEGTGHWIQLDEPAEFDRILAEFLAATSPTP
jgi:pimeloyl-ACP methyl ester carboxylesterase